MEHLHADATEARRLASASIQAIEPLIADLSSPQPALLNAKLRAEIILAICQSIDGQLHASIQSGLALLDRAADAPPSLHARLLNMLGVNYDTLEQHSKALELYSRCLSIQRRHGDNASISRVLGNIGVVYSRLGDEPRALKHLLEAIALGQRSGSTPGSLARHTLNAAISLQHLGRLDEASAMLAKAECFARKAGHNHTLAYVLVNRSDFHIRNDHPQEALQSIETAMNYCGRLPNLRSTLFLKKAQVLRITDRTASIATALAGLEAARDHEATEPLAKLHELLSELHEENGDFKTALHHHRKLHATRSALILRSQDARVANLQSLHELDRTRQERDWLVRERKMLREANARLVGMDRERKELLSIAIHDIRSPLTVVALMADLMSIGELHASEIVVTGDRLKSACRRTVEIIDKLLSVRVLERGEQALTLERLDPTRLLNMVLVLLRPLAARKNIQIHAVAADHCFVLVDPVSLEQILDNLIGNAIKFTPSGGTIHVEVKQQVSSVCFSVRDTGPGLTEDDHCQLFQKYARLSAKPTAGESSTGLGLYITHKLVALMNGTIHASNSTQGGASFQVTLPLALVG
ncbi:MAG: tetratricopeptide repeat-containing sensor histidine kinase [Myxococcota bacterium]|nr:tetratricopeptide repeat-containing sensor histidine kinase [Myxococcota bacterium]